MWEEKSRELTTFLSPSGRYRYKRLSRTGAPEFFQEFMEGILHTVKLPEGGALVGYIDDIAAAARSLKEVGMIMRDIGKVLK
jgi:hypothetical protein